MTLFHSFLKAAEAIATGYIIGIILSRFRVCLAEEFYYMEAAFVNVEVEVPLFKVGCMGFPNPSRKFGHNNRLMHRLGKKPVLCIFSDVE